MMKTTIARREFFQNFVVGAAGAMAFPYIARTAGSTGKLNVAFWISALSYAGWHDGNMKREKNEANEGT